MKPTKCCLKKGEGRGNGNIKQRGTSPRFTEGICGIIPRGAMTGDSTLDERDTLKADI
jgi:hypothetical protein